MLHRLFYIIALASFALAFVVLARDNGQWGKSAHQNPAVVPAAHAADNPLMSGCGEADAFEADSFEWRMTTMLPSSPTAKELSPTARNALFRITR
jgi:hypothetical protein